MTVGGAQTATQNTTQKLLHMEELLPSFRQRALTKMKMMMTLRVLRPSGVLGTFLPIPQ